MKKAIFFILYFIGHSIYAQTSFPHNIVIDPSFGILDPVSVFATDFNNDNKKDLLVANRSYNIYWLKNTDDEKQFDHSKFLFKHNASIIKVFSADVNNDMILDIVFSAQNGLYLMKGIDHDVNFAAPVKLTSNDVRTFDVLDINNDGKLDFFVLNQNTTCGWLKNDGNGNFSTLISLQSTNATVFADLDNDNIPDLISKTTNYNLEWFKNDGLGNFSKKQTITTSAIGTNIQVGDIDGDGDMDIVFLYENGANQFKWYNNSNGLGLFSGVKVIGTLPTMANNNLVRIIDMDNDDKVDLVYSYSPSNIAWKKNLGSGNFSQDKIITQNVKYISELNVADLNNDGKNDLYSASEGDDKIAWYKQLDNGVYSPEKILTTSAAGVNKICIGDIDGDGDDDILTTSTSDYKISWFRNINGKGDLSEQNIISNDLMYASDGQLIDVDNDGDKDVVVRHEYYDNGTKFRILWFENNGLGVFDKQHIILDGMSQYINHISAGDIDKDGNIDIVFALEKGRLGWFKNNGSGQFGTPIYFTDIQYDKDFAMGLETLDMDNDGDLDVLVHYNSKSIEWYENKDGAGSFSLKYKILDSSYIINVFPDDIDGDGDLDLLFATGSQRTLGWYENVSNGNYVKNIISTSLQKPSSLIVMDIDGDGKKDIITNSDSMPKLLYYKNNGDKTFSAPFLISNDIGSASEFAFSDFNADGKKELVVSSVEDIQGGDLITWFETGAAFENRIKGTVRYDVDNNGCDNNDDSATLIKVTSQNSQYTYSTFTDSEGKYNLIANKDQFTTYASSPLPNYTITPQNYVSNFTELGITDEKNFCISPDLIFNDVEISMYPISVSRPGFDTKYKVLISNKGTQKISGLLDFVYNGDKMSFLNSSTSIASQSAGKLVFNIDGLSPFHTKIIDINFKILTLPVNNIGDQLDLTGIMNINADINPENNEFTLHQVIVGSYDPNDIHVLEGAKILIENKDEWLHYIVRFQNTGNYFAQQVRIQNTLDSKLDGSTLTVESYSHNNNIKITNNNLLEVNFDGIYLPGSDDENNSHGYVAYKIRPKSNVKLGDIFYNKAEIYFDYNPLIETNTVSTEIVETILGTHEVAKGKIVVYPNPSTGILNIETTENIKTIEVFNSLGQKMKSSENSKILDMSALKSGVYFVKVSMQNTTSKSFKIIKK